MARKQDTVKICLWTHVQNEAGIIERMLQSAVDYIDYWVIVDNGSTDGTQDIIKNFFDKEGIPGQLYQSEIGWKGHGINRQHSWDFLCKTNHGCQYILRMDADEGLAVDDDFDWSCIGNHDSYNVIFVSGNYCIPRTWLWDFQYEYYWQDDEAHETIHRKDGGHMVQQQLPFGFRQISLGTGQSYYDPIKYVKDVLKLETQLHERLRDGSSTNDEYYHLYYLCRSFNYTNFFLENENVYKFFPYGRDSLEMFLNRGIYYYNKLIETFGSHWVHYYFRGNLHGQLNNIEEQYKDYETSYSIAPYRAEAACCLFRHYRDTKKLDLATKWANVLDNIKLDFERDPYDVELDKYPDKNANLRKELDEFMGKNKTYKNVIDYSLNITNRSVITI